MDRRAYIRGLGAFTPLGATWPEAAAALAEGRSAIGPVTRFDASGFPCTVAASIADGAWEESGAWEEDGASEEGAWKERAWKERAWKERAWKERAWKERARAGIPEDDAAASKGTTSDRKLAFARSAAREAWRAADLSVDPRRLGVFLGAESGRASFSTLLRLAAAGGGKATFDHQQFGKDARLLASRIDSVFASPAAVASALACAIGAEGPAQAVSLACASGSAAIAEGARAIRLGLCDAVLCGGVGADVDPLMFAAFGLLGALSLRGVSRPFDVHRDGFVVGEGAAMVVLSCDPGASPGARTFVAGTGRTLDAYHLTAPDPEGDGAFRAMREALRDAGLSAVDYVQAHGTSTPLNDAVEASAIRRALGPRLDEAHVSSVKGAMGHWIAGAGALGFLCAASAIETGIVLPTAGLEHQDKACDLPHVMGKAIRKGVRAALVNSFGFGGANCSLVLRSAS